jgi:hypothetical protein
MKQHSSGFGGDAHDECSDNSPRVAIKKADGETRDADEEEG